MVAAGRYRQPEHAALTVTHLGSATRRCCHSRCLPGVRSSTACRSCCPGPSAYLPQGGAAVPLPPVQDAASKGKVSGCATEVLAQRYPGLTPLQPRYTSRLEVCQVASYPLHGQLAQVLVRLQQQVSYTGSPS